MAEKRIYKVEDDKKIFGVCGGVAEYLGVDPTLVRVIWAVLCFMFCVWFRNYCISNLRGCIP